MKTDIQIAQEATMLPISQIADSLGISVNTVKYHIKGAIARIYNHLERYLLLVAVGCMIF